MVTHTRMRWLALMVALTVTACSGSEPGDDDLSEDDAPTGTDDDNAEGDDEGDDTGDDDTGDDDTGDEDDGDDDPGAGRDAGAGRDSGASASDASRPTTDAGGDAARPSDGGPRAPDAAAPSDAGPAPSSDDVPAGAHCAEVASWDAQSAMFEQQVLELTNAARAAGHNCDTMGMFGPAPALKMEPRLRCSARLHSAYMAKTMEFAHTQSATGLDPFKRMMAAGYQFRLAGENIAYGQRSPQEVVSGWLDSDGHCANIMNPRFTELGVGYVVAMGMSTRPGRASPYWTQNFGTPR